MDRINETLIHAGQWFVRHSAAELHVLHVWEAYGASYMRRAGARPAYVRDHIAEVRKERGHELQQAVAPFRRWLPSEHIHLARGEARQVIPAFARSRNFDLVVMSSVGRRGLARWILGNTAEVVIATLRGSLLVMKPGGR
jgi:nucleotide-binding universal stress UspA family protein